MKKTLTALAGFVVLAGFAGQSIAQTIETDPVACIPHEANTVVRAVVQPDISGSDEMRLYFRRLNTVGGYYYVPMSASGGGVYWGVLPKPEERETQDLTDDWWDILQHRDWMQIEERDREWLEDWLDGRDHEAAEYYVAAVDSSGAVIAEAETQLVPVIDRDDCVIGYTAAEWGQSQSLTVGETLEVQKGAEVFHWLCDGIVTRVDFEDILRPDEFCRACVVAGFPIAPIAGALVAGGAITVQPPPPTTRVQP